MSVNFNVDLGRIYADREAASLASAKGAKPEASFTKTAVNSLHNVNKMQQEADISITDLFSGQQDINSVVASVAKADMSFKLLVGVRNKLVEAYKETMKMQG